MTTNEFIDAISGYNAVLPANVEITLTVYKDDFTLNMENSELPYSSRTIYNRYRFKSEDFERVLNHVKLEVESV